MVITEKFTNYGSSTTWTVPDAVEEVVIKTWGARGGDGGGSVNGSPSSQQATAGGGYGKGGKAEATVPVTPGDTLDIYVGELTSSTDGGYPDGMDGQESDRSGDDGVTVVAESGGGGGSSRVEVSGTVLVQAGGGGGGGACAASTDASHDDPDYDESPACDAGDGGNANTGDGTDASATATGADYYENDTETVTASTSGGANGGGKSYGSTGYSDFNNVATATGGGGGGGRNSGTKPTSDIEDGSHAALAAAAGGGGSGTSYFDSSATNTSTTNSTTSPDNGTNGEVIIEYEEPPEPPTELSVAGGSREADLSWTNDPDGYDEVDVYRATQSGDEDTADYTLVETIGGTAETYTDTGLDDGERYYYRVRGVIDGISVGLSNEDDGTTDLPAPTNLTHPSTGDEGAEYDWTANHNRGDTRVEYRESDSSEWQTYATVAFDVESETVDGLLNGEEYDSRVVAETEHAEAEDE